MNRVVSFACNPILEHAEGVATSNLKTHTRFGTVVGSVLELYSDAFAL